MNYLGSKTLETERLILRKTEEKDLKPLWEILLKEEVSKYYLTSKIHQNWEEEQTWQYKKLERASNPDTFIWTIERKEDHAIMGQISFHGLDQDSSKDIGWFLGTEYQHKGYMTEAANAVLRYMFLEVGIQDVDTCAATDNPPSWKLMERLGFQPKGTTRMEKYTGLEQQVECKEYIYRRKDYLNKEGESNGSISVS